MSDTPEFDRLAKRLAGAVHFNVWWGPDAGKLTSEERAKVINDSLDQIESGESELVTDIDGDLCDQPPATKRTPRLVSDIVKELDR